MFEILKKIAFQRKYNNNNKCNNRENIEKVKRQIEQSLWGSISTVNVIVDDVSRKQTINILMPDVSPHMSAGPLSILYFSRFLSKTGYHVRLLIDSNKTEEELKNVLKQQSNEISQVIDRLEVNQFPLQKNPNVIISSTDMTVATLFNTAYAAKKIQSYCRDKKFIYFIQDDERAFFPASSLQCIVEESYGFDFYPLFSTEILKNFFIKENIGDIRNKIEHPLSQGCPSNCYLPDFKSFLERGKKKKFVFYARPHVSRNCYEYAMYAIILATELNIFNSDWDLYGMGFPKNETLELANGQSLHLIQNMPLRDYKCMLHTFDVGLSLMATPHPSMPPIDLALSGCIVVTNSYKNKTNSTMHDICENIICAEMSVDGIINALKEAIDKSCNLEQRYKNAKHANWPKNWDETFTNEHANWINCIMRTL